MSYCFQYKTCQTNTNTNSSCSGVQDRPVGQFRPCEEKAKKGSCLSWFHTHVLIPYTRPGSILMSWFQTHYTHVLVPDTCPGSMHMSWFHTHVPIPYTCPSHAQILIPFPLFLHDHSHPDSMFLYRHSVNLGMWLGMEYLPSHSMYSSQSLVTRVSKLETTTEQGILSGW